MDNAERSRLTHEFEKALEDGTAADATDEQLLAWLTALCTGAVQNPDVHPRIIVKGVTVNHIQMARAIRHLEETIKRIDADNRRTQLLIVVLTILTIIVGIDQIVIAVMTLASN